MGAFLLLRINERLQHPNKITAALRGRREYRGGDHHSCQGRARHAMKELCWSRPTLVGLLLGSDRTASGKA
jgi:hypothetical protein